ncbi:uncharacterized protein [Clytia hemisphaerica]|uniref:uncharacterized protein n=1 Tax=Clytia hemisphaerica TaxID=252671 RepID=UPI0034D53020
MTYEHNHPVNSLEALSFKRISEEILIEVLNLFEKGNTPSQAYQEFLRTLKLHCEDQIKFHLSKADRSKCPRRRDFNSLYIKFCKEKFGGKNGADMFEKLEERINQFEENMDGIKVAYQLYNEDENSALILAILTPLMIRVHRMVRESSEIVFIDSTSNLDEHNLRFFLLVTHSVAGALPLGIIITSDEREETIVKALTLYKGILPEEAFYNSPTGPDIFMTDNCGELRNSLHRIWPDSTLLLCIFHILQQVWRWLYDKNHGVSQNDRVEIMKLFKNVIYALNLEEFEETSVLLQESNVTSKYEHCISYFEELFSLSKSWAKCFRSEILIRGSHTNNYVESQFLVIKDSILRRQRQFNINMLLDKLMVEFEDHYKNRLLSIADSTFDGVYSQRFKQIKLKKVPGKFCLP